MPLKPNQLWEVWGCPAGFLFSKKYFIMRLVTWNINSVRLRLPLLQKLIAQQNPDVICLQECKVDTPFFPYEEIKVMGYSHIHYWGMKGYNGTAILSKLPFQDQAIHDHVGKSDCRHVVVTIDGVELHNLYIPAGGPDPDPIGNPNFKFKLDFVEEMTAWCLTNLNNNKPIILVGDLNIAPFEHDVWSHKQMLKVVSHTPEEVTRFNKMRDGFGWVDAMRHFVPVEEKLYTWWSYRARDWAASDRGRRLDHIWVTPPLQDHLQKMSVMREARAWERPSDHVPVVMDLK